MPSVQNMSAYSTGIDSYKGKQWNYYKHKLWESWPQLQEACGLITNWKDDCL